jgi:predicted Zn-dependent protease
VSGEAVNGFLFAPKSANAREAQISAGESGALALVAGDATSPIDPARVTISARLAEIPRRVEFLDGSVFETPDNDGIDRLFQLHGAGGVSARLARLEQFKLPLLFFVAALIGVIVVTIRWGLPALSEVSAALVPPAVEQNLGQETLKTLDRLMLRPSQVDQARRDQVVAIMKQLDAASDAAGNKPQHYTLIFRKGGVLGPNAFSLPGGIVIVTDELIDLAPNDDAIAGTLAHEMGHVIGHHPMRRETYGAGLSVMAMLVGGGTRMHNAAAQVSAGLLNNAYSREFEREADATAEVILEKAGRNPDGLAQMLEALSQKCGAACDALPWLSNHPSIRERVKAIRNRRTVPPL